MSFKRSEKVKHHSFKKPFGFRRDLYQAGRIARWNVMSVLQLAVVYHKVCDHWIIQKTQKCKRVGHSFLESVVMTLLEDVFLDETATREQLLLLCEEGPFICEEEMWATKKAADLFDQFIKTYDLVNPDSLALYIYTPLWKKVIKAARKAFGIMQRNDRKYYLKHLTYLTSEIEEDEEWQTNNPGIVLKKENILQINI